MQLYKSIAFKTKVLLLLLTIGSWNLFASTSPVVQPPSFNGIKLIENKGQWPAEVLFKANIPGGDLYITSSGIVYSLIDEQALHDLAHSTNPNTIVKGHNYKMTFSGGNQNISTAKQYPSNEIYNYFIGSDKEKWAGNCKAYQTVVLQNIYNGIDAEIVAKDDYIKLNFIVHPNADPDQIVLSYDGIENISLKDSAISIQTSVACIKENKPVAFQNGVEISCRYQLQHKKVRFVLPDYNASQELIIDPEIVFATYSGSVSDNFGFTGTFDDAGNGFAGGTVFGTKFPVTFGAYQINYAGGEASLEEYARDIGILKFSPDGKNLLYATYLGGNRNEQPHSLICNQAGELYILGTTKSANFPTSTTAFDKNHNGGYDIIVSKLSASGSQLLASTYWGGSDDDGINGTNSEKDFYRTSNPLTYNYGDFFRGEISLDKNNKVYIVSSTQSSSTENYPLQLAFQNSFGGGNQDGIIFSLSADLSTLHFSSYLGGTGEDAIYGITFDANNDVLICGGTTSNSIGKNNGAFSYKGDVDGFIAKINGTSKTLVKLVYIGTDRYDQTYFIDTDPWNNIYVTGQTRGSFPVKGNVFKNNNGTQYISSFNNNLDSFIYSTTIGNGANTINLSPSAFMVDYCGRVYFSGWGGGSNVSFNDSTGYTNGLNTTPDAFRAQTDWSDFYLIVLSKNLASLSYATYIGGTRSQDHVDGGTSRFNKNGMVYQSICASCGVTSDLPVTPQCYSATNKGVRPNGFQRGCNNALLKFNMDPTSNTPIMKDTLLKVIATDTLTHSFTLKNFYGDSIYADFSGLVLSLPNAPTFEKIIGSNTINVKLKWKTLCENISPDTFKISVSIKAMGCRDTIMQTAIIKILVLPPPVFVPPYPHCLKTINDSTVNITWPTITASTRYFKRIEIFKSVNGNPFISLGNITSAKDSSFIDKKAYNHLTVNTCYYLVGINTCDSVSQMSRNVCSINPNDSTTNNDLFDIPSDTIIYVYATDTLNYTYTAYTKNSEDSIYISASGSLIETNRVFFLTHIPNKQTATFRLSWKSLCEDIDPDDTLTIHFIVRDNQCPQPRTKQSKIKVIVLPPPINPPPVMRCTRNTGTNSVLVRYEKPIIENRYFSHFVLIRKNMDGSFTELSKIYNDNALSFNDPNASNNNTENICYGTYAVNVCGIIGDTSEFACTVIKNPIAPPPLYIYTTTVIKNDYIQLQWAKSNEPDFLSYKILKRNAQDQFTPYFETGVINDTIFNDKAVNVHSNIYCYQVKQVNDCGIANQDPYEACSILLKGKSIPFSHSLVWNDYNYFKNGLNRYVLIKEEPNTAPIEANKYTFKNTLGADNDLNIDNGLYYYTIEARESNSPFTSVSNTVELIQAPLLHVPNVFTNNNDGLNDVWKPVPVFVKDYNLKLYDRWGQLIFETNDKKQPFNGQFKESPTTADVFVYLITYTGWDGSSHSVNGNVTQLK
jgi:gliding motility-associated-like protein